MKVWSVILSTPGSSVISPVIKVSVLRWCCVSAEDNHLNSITAWFPLRVLQDTEALLDPGLVLRV